MANDDGEQLGNLIDLTAVKRRIELQVVQSFILRNGGVSDKDARQMAEVLMTFEHHGIGAMEALDIMQEITRIYAPVKGKEDE